MFISKVKSSSSKGFTLIEIIVVISIIVIISMVSIPQVGNVIKNKRLFDAVEKLNDDLNYCRDYAIAQHTNTFILFESGNNRYRIFYGNTWGSSIPLFNPVLNSTDWFEISNQFHGIGLESASFTSNLLSFDWGGTPSQGGTVILTTGSNSHTITVKSGTGYVER